MIHNVGLSSLVTNGSGRLFEDGDGHAELSTWPGTSKAVSQTADYRVSQKVLKVVTDLKSQQPLNHH